MNFDKYTAKDFRALYESGVLSDAIVNAMLTRMEKLEAIQQNQPLDLVKIGDRVKWIARHDRVIHGEVVEVDPDELLVKVKPDQLSISLWFPVSDIQLE